MISLPSLWKRFTRPEAKPYDFPEARDIAVQPAPPLVSFDEEEEDEESEKREQTEEAVEEGTEEEEEAEEEKGEEEELISFARIQAETITREAEAEAARILETAREKAKAEAEEVFAKAKADGQREGYNAGMTQALEEGRKHQAAQAEELGASVEQFLKRANTMLEHQMDENIDELRDLAMAIAEKVICISLKSSGEVIGRMIQTAIDKKKRKEWVHIYIAECDAKRMTQVPPSLAASLSALSDRVRIIPMGEDEPGTCIIEMPDEIIDASAATQLDNIRSLLSDAPSGNDGGNMFQFGM